MHVTVEDHTKKGSGSNTGILIWIGVIVSVGLLAMAINMWNEFTYHHGGYHYDGYCGRGRSRRKNCEHGHGDYDEDDNETRIVNKINVYKDGSKEQGGDRS